MGRIADIIDMVKEGRLGFQMDEIMSGEHEFEPEFGTEGKFPFEFQVTWGPKEMGAWLNPKSNTFMVQPLKGTVSVGGLCSDTPCEGTLELRYFKDHKIRYNFEFKVDDVEYVFLGEKVNIKPWNLPISHTTCFGVLTEKSTGKLVSRSITHFRLKTSPAFLASFRLV